MRVKLGKGIIISDLMGLWGKDNDEGKKGIRKQFKLIECGIYYHTFRNRLAAVDCVPFSKYNP